MTDATDHYDVRGSGPVLLIIPGGAGHPMGLGPLTDALAGRFTVVTYDPLGLAHGRLGEPVGDQRVEDWSEGAHRVLDAVLADGDSAFVLGTSAGAVAALDLLARHPDRLGRVVTHEPPVVGILPDGAERQAEFRAVCDAYDTAGLDAAARRMTAVLAGQQPEDDDTEPRPLPRSEELSNPMALSLRHVLRPFTAYTPATDLPGIQLTVAAGADSRGQLLHRTAELLAASTHSEFVEFPGGHMGTLQHPAAFAERLTETLKI
ncbi:alpha/beta fold hydrolase [Streptomyces griseus]|uniref:alpha/beta fold hydrolase n=1 Tax=Streptomyces griseus TaxID=1911 RepID=UPI0005610A3C|nr:alpha/beta hydrolase [Streptomyces griseus]